MSKKNRLVKELNEVVSREATVDECQTCKTHFYSQISRDAHFKLYPSHLKQQKEVTQ